MTPRVSLEDGSSYSGLKHATRLWVEGCPGEYACHLDTVAGVRVEPPELCSVCMKYPEHNAIRILETPGSVDVGMLGLSDQEPLRRASFEDGFDIDDPELVVVVEADQVSVPVHKGEAPRHRTLGVSDRSHGFIGMVDPRCRSSCSGSEEANVTVGHAKGEVAATASHAETGGPRQLIGPIRREVEPTKPTVTALNGDHGASDIESGGVDRVCTRLEHEAVRIVVDV